MSKFSVLIIHFILIAISGYSKPIVTIRSGNAQIEVQVQRLDGELRYAVLFNGQEVISPSKLGLVATALELTPVRIITSKRTEKREKWERLFGKSRWVDNHYREAFIKAKTRKGLLINIIFRVFDDGVAICYGIPEQEGIDSLTVTDDRTSFRFVENFSCRAIGENVETSSLAQKPLSQISFAKPPLLIEVSNCWMALNEASVFDFSMTHFTAGDRAYELKSAIGRSAVKLPFKTPWRVIQMGARPGDLITSDILVNLNERCKIEDPSWIQPGKALWDWRNHGDTINGFTYGQDEASYRRLIDFASANQLGYVLFDAEWYSTRGPQFPKDDLDMPALIRYAAGKGVSVLLYIDRKRKGEQMTGMSKRY